MTNRPIRIAVRAVILHQDRLLLVNAWPASVGSDLWCAPGGGVEKGRSLPDNLEREIMEECGLSIQVGAPCLVNEFHNPDDDFHQVEVFFRCRISSPIPEDWTDPEGIVTQRGFFDRHAVETLHLKPDTLRHIAWEETIAYDPLERLSK